MPLRILTNVQSLFAQRNLGIAQRSLGSALEKLSSGLRINHSYDDPSGFLYSVQMTFKIQGTEAGTNNLRMAVEVMNTADSYTRTIAENMERMGELGTQATNNLLTAQQRSAMQFEFNELIDEIQRLTVNAVYNGRTLLDGSMQGVTVQAGYSVADVISISINGLTIGTLGIASLSLATIGGANQAITIVNSAAAFILSPAVAAIGAQAAGWLKSTDAQDAYTTNLRAARSRILDTDVAVETTNLTNAQVIVQSGIAALAQANSAQTLALGLISGR